MQLPALPRGVDCRTWLVAILLILLPRIILSFGILASVCHRSQGNSSVLHKQQAAPKSRSDSPEDPDAGLPLRDVRKTNSFLTYGGNVLTVPESILQRAQSLPEGGILSPREFLHLGSRAAVDQAFSRLAKAGKLLRVSRGAYVAPISGRFGRRSPSPASVVQALAERGGEVLVPHGASAANMLRLTQQVPVREVYLTSGRTRTLKLGKSEVMVKHAPQWMLALGARPAGAAVRALAWIGPKHIAESLASLRHRLPEAEWLALAAARAMLPGWMAQAIGRELARG